MKISTRGNSVLISIPRGEVQQLGVEQDGNVVEGLTLDALVFGRRLIVSICAEKKDYPQGENEDRNNYDNGIDPE